MNNNYSFLRFHRKFIFFLLISYGLLLSCNKAGDDIPTSFEGTWKMILVKDNVTNTFTSKPSSIHKDVIINFNPSGTSGGSFTGMTPTNDIMQNTYSVGPNQTISIPVLSMTKVAETSWGAE